MHKGRFAATALAIVLGAAFVTATLVFTDSLDARFASQAEGGADRVDAVVLPAEAGGAVPAAALERVRALPGVSAATGTVRGQAVLLDGDGAPLGQAPALALSAGGAVTRLPAAEGRLPAASGEAALATTTAQSAGYGLGDTVAVVGRDGAEHVFTITGLIDFGLDREAAQRGAVAFTPATARRITGAEGFGEIAVRAADGVAPERVRAAVAGVLGDRGEVLTGAEFGRMKAEEAGVQSRTIGVALLLFAAVALFVAGLVINNTFAVLVNRRLAETALLRCLGAARRQVFAGVLAEALAVGALASALGVLAGIGTALGAVRISDALPKAAGVFGPGVDDLSAVVRPGAVLIGLAVGVVTTVAAALRPAYLATRTAPLAALRDAAAEDADAIGARRAARRRLVAAGVFAAASAAVTAAGLTAEPGAAAMAVVAGGGGLAFAAVLLAAPRLVSAAARTAERPLGLLGVPGRLAAGNARRSPRRTATAVVALAVGAGLITGYSVVSASVEATLAHLMARELPADYALLPAETGGQGDAAGGPRLPGGLAEQLRRSPVLDEVIRVRRGQARLVAAGADGGGAAPVRINTYPGARLGTDLAAGTTAGSLADVGPGRASIAEDDAQRLGVQVGDAVALAVPAGTESGGADGVPGERVRVRIAAVTAKADFPGGFTLAPPDFAALFPDRRRDDSLLVIGAADADAQRVRTVVEEAAAAHPGVRVSSAAAQRAQFGRLFDGIFLAVAALLGVAVTIAVVGIANTLALSVMARSREFALLRALGLTRSQLHRTLAAEALLVALLGAVLGAVLGAGFGLAAADAAMSDMVPDIPVARVALLLSAAIPAGLLAALAPAWQAARIPVGSVTSEGG
ncbi:ABC transporter permease [Streptomonospora sp. PA3]|nr:ABC transporter permease [Streptomonospora sp. PA3]